MLFFFMLYAIFSIVAIGFWLSRVGLTGVDFFILEMTVEEQKLFFVEFMSCFFILSMVLLA